MITCVKAKYITVHSLNTCIYIYTYINYIAFHFTYIYFLEPKKTNTQKILQQQQVGIMQFSALHPEPSRHNVASPSGWLIPRGGNHLKTPPMRGGRVVGALNSSHMAHLRAKFPPWCTFRPMDSSVREAGSGSRGFFLTEVMQKQ